MKDEKDKIIYWQKRVIGVQEKIIEQQKELINILKQRIKKPLK